MGKETLNNEQENHNFFNRIFKKTKTRGVSPVIATVLLITMVVVVGLIVFVWFRGMTQEVITKFGGTNIEIVCNDINFDASYSGGMLAISNTGNVPIFEMDIKIFREGSHETKSIRDLSGNWPDAGVNQGGIFSDDVSSEVGDGNKIILIPILIGKSEKGEKTFVCSERQHGYEIIL